MVNDDLTEHVLFQLFSCSESLPHDGGLQQAVSDRSPTTCLIPQHASHQVQVSPDVIIIFPVSGLTRQPHRDIAWYVGQNRTGRLAVRFPAPAVCTHKKPWRTQPTLMCHPSGAVATKGAVSVCVKSECDKHRKAFWMVLETIKALCKCKAIDHVICLIEAVQSKNLNVHIVSSWYWKHAPFIFLFWLFILNFHCTGLLSPHAVQDPEAFTDSEGPFGRDQQTGAGWYCSAENGERPHGGSLSLFLSHTNTQTSCLGFGENMLNNTRKTKYDFTEYNVFLLLMCLWFLSSHRYTGKNRLWLSGLTGSSKPWGEF